MFFSECYYNFDSRYCDFEDEKTLITLFFKIQTSPLCATPN